MSTQGKAAPHRWLVVGIAALGVAACAGEDEADDLDPLPPLPAEVIEGDQPLMEDYEIRGAVRGELWADEEVGRRAIAVHVHRGVVTLTGVVNDQEAKRHAVQQAADVPGVRAVIDRLRVIPRPYVERRQELERERDDALARETP